MSNIKKSISKRLARVGLRIQQKPFRIRRWTPLSRRAKAVRRMLSADLLEPVILERHEPDNALFKLFREFGNLHKWHHYFDIYCEEFEPLRHRPIRMLEIGVCRGGSLQMWRQWFHPDSVIVGIDIEQSCQQYEDTTRNIFVRIGDQSDPVFLQDLAAQFGPFDLILDDGGHTTSQMMASFNGLFHTALAAGGIYLVEDTHTNFWPRFVDSEITFIEFCKGLVELMHAHYADLQSTELFRFQGERAVRTLEAPYVQAWIRRISFYDSIVVIEKKARAVPVHEVR
jgi:hypothetical protein